MHIGLETKVQILNQGSSLLISAALHKTDEKAQGLGEISLALVAELRETRESLAIDTNEDTLHLMRRLPQPKSIGEMEQCLQEFLSSYDHLKTYLRSSNHDGKPNV